MLGSVSWGDVDWDDALEKDEEEQREIVTEMRDDQGMSPDEIAQETGLEQSRVKTLLAE